MGVGRQHWWRVVAEKFQGKHIEGVESARLDDHKEGHKNSLYWVKVYWVDASASNGGAISQWWCCISYANKLPYNEDRYGNLGRP